MKLPSSSLLLSCFLAFICATDALFIPDTGSRQDVEVDDLDSLRVGRSEPSRSRENSNSRENVVVRLAPKDRRLDDERAIALNFQLTPDHTALTINSAIFYPVTTATSSTSTSATILTAPLVLPANVWTYPNPTDSFSPSAESLISLPQHRLSYAVAARVEPVDVDVVGGEGEGAERVDIDIWVRGLDDQRINVDKVAVRLLRDGMERLWIEDIRAVDDDYDEEEGEKTSSPPSISAAAAWDGKGKERKMIAPPHGSASFSANGVRGTQWQWPSGPPSLLNPVHRYPPQHKYEEEEEICPSSFTPYTALCNLRVWVARDRTMGDTLSFNRNAPPLRLRPTTRFSRQSSSFSSSSLQNHDRGSPPTSTPPAYPWHPWPPSRHHDESTAARGFGALRINHKGRGFFAAVRVAIVAVLFPALVGVASGIVASIIGLCVGTALAWCWMRWRSGINGAGAGARQAGVEEGGGEQLLGGSDDGGGEGEREGYRDWDEKRGLRIMMSRQGQGQERWDGLEVSSSPPHRHRGNVYV